MEKLTIKAADIWDYDMKIAEKNKKIKKRVDKKWKK